MSAEVCPHCLSAECGVVLCDNAVPLLRVLLECRNRVSARAAKADTRIADLEHGNNILVGQLTREAGHLVHYRDKAAALEAKLTESERLLTVYRAASIRDGLTMGELYTALGKATGWGVESQALAAKVNGAAEIDRMRSRLAEFEARVARSFPWPACALCGIKVMATPGGLAGVISGKLTCPDGKTHEVFNV